LTDTCNSRCANRDQVELRCSAAKVTPHEHGTLACIEAYTSIVIEMDDATIAGLRS
jgi:hypothetical protein